MTSFGVQLRQGGCLSVRLECGHSWAGRLPRDDFKAGTACTRRAWDTWSTGGGLDPVEPMAVAPRTSITTLWLPPTRPAHNSHLGPYPTSPSFTWNTKIPLTIPIALATSSFNAHSALSSTFKQFWHNKSASHKEGVVGSTRLENHQQQKSGLCPLLRSSHHGHHLHVSSLVIPLVFAIAGRS